MPFDPLNPPDSLAGLDNVPVAFRSYYRIDDQGMYVLVEDAIIQTAMLREQKAQAEAEAQHRAALEGLNQQARAAADGMNSAVVRAELGHLVVELGGIANLACGAVAELLHDAKWTIREQGGKKVVLCDDPDMGELPARVAVRQFLDSPEGKGYLG
jgi:hypothetical protein